MGQYQICDYCGNLVERTNHPMCRKCLEQFTLVREVVGTRPNITVLEASRLTGVTINKIHLFAEKGWFILNQGAIELMD